MKYKSVFLLAAVLAVAGCVGATDSAGTGDDTTSGQVSEVPEGAAVVEMTSSGFSPATVTVSAGDTVAFVNEGNSNHWPASAIHPTHRVYPGSGIEKCATPEQGGIFDSCVGIRPGGIYTFTFSETGTWRYHDHLNPSLTGTVVVE